MTDRAPDGQSGPPQVRGRRRNSAFFAGLIAIMRLGLLAITFAATLNALTNVFRGGALSRTLGAPLGWTYLALAMAAASAAFMVASTLNAAFLVGRLFSRRASAYVVAAVLVLGVGSVAVGLHGSAKLGTITLISVLVPAVSFVLSMLLVGFAGPASRARSSPRRTAAAPQPPAREASKRPRSEPQRRRRKGTRR
jgi:hypothetical protein